MNTAQSQTDLINLALVYLSNETIINPQQKSAAAEDLKRVYPRVRDIELRHHPWNCAAKYVALAKVADDSIDGIGAPYNQPDDYLRVNQMIDRRVNYRVIGKRIYADTEGPLQMIYGYRLEDVTQFDAGLVDAIALRMAAMVAYKVTRSAAMQTRMWRLYTDLVRPDSRTSDGQEGTPRSINDDEYANSRMR